jgi:hypothetical protein
MLSTRLGHIATFLMLVAAYASPILAVDEAVVSPVDTVAAPIDEREVMLKNLIEAGILMLEGKAYEQFIQAFVSPEDRRRFEQSQQKHGGVNYPVWGKEKGARLLQVLKNISVKDFTIENNKVCFRSEVAPSGAFSFTYSKGVWYIENQPKCPAVKSAPSGEDFKRSKPAAP